MILSTACHDFAFQVQCFPFRVSHIPNVRVQVTSHHNAASRRCGIHHLVGPVVYPVCRPITHWWGVEPHQQKRSNFAVLILIAPPLPCTLASGEATSRICQISQKSILTATMSPACRFVPRPIPWPHSNSLYPASTLCVTGEQ